MTPEEPTRRRAPIPGLGLSLEVDPSWRREEHALDDGRIVNYRLPDHDAVVYVRFGAAQTLDRFLAGLEDLLTAATVLADESTELAGLPARRLTISRHPRDPTMPGPRTRPTHRLQVIELALTGTPVLVGYRVADERAAALQPLLDRVLDSVAVTPPGS